MGYALTSIVCGIFDVKHYLHLQVWDFLSTNQILSNDFNDALFSSFHIFRATIR